MTDSTLFSDACPRRPSFRSDLGTGASDLRTANQVEPVNPQVSAHVSTQCQRDSGVCGPHLSAAHRTDAAPITTPTLNDRS